MFIQDTGYHYKQPIVAVTRAFCYHTIGIIYEVSEFTICACTSNGGRLEMRTSACTSIGSKRQITEAALQAVVNEVLVMCMGTQASTKSLLQHFGQAKYFFCSDDVRCQLCRCQASVNLAFVQNSC